MTSQWSTASKVRVSGPFTVEALSRYADNPFDGTGSRRSSADSTLPIMSRRCSTRCARMGIPRKGKPARRS